MKCKCVIKYLCVSVLWNGSSLLRASHQGLPGLHCAHHIKTSACLPPALTLSTPNLHTLPSDIPESLLAKTYIPPSCLIPGLQPSWDMIPDSDMLSALHFSILVFLLSWHSGSKSFFLSVPLLSNPRFLPLLTCPAIGCRQSYLPIRTNLVQGPSASYMQILVQFRESS